MVFNRHLKALNLCNHSDTIACVLYELLVNLELIIVGFQTHVQGSTSFSFVQFSRSCCALLTGCPAGQLDYDTTADTVFSAFMESGCAVEEIKEEENEKFHVFHVKGKGSFSQITAAFGIIKSKERWSAAELCALKREGNLLAYEVEVRAVRNRGTYEKEKYSPDRAYGDGKEPGSQNTRRRL